MSEKYNKLGHLYEALFNVGLLKVLNEKANFYPYWLKNFENYPLRDYALRIFNDTRITELFEKVLSRVMFIYETQGYVFGKNLLEDLKNREKPEVFFYYGKPIPVEDDREFFLQRFTEQFGEIPSEFVSDEKGSLLHVDLIVHFFNKSGKSSLHYITVADLSLVKANELGGYYDHLNREDTFQAGLSGILETDEQSVISGYLFKPINLKGGGNFKQLLDKLFKLKTEDSERLKEFFQLLEKKNREVSKLVQASSYAGEYLKLLLQKGVITEKTRVVLRIFGITLHKVAQISFSLEKGISEVFFLLRKAKEVYSSVSGGRLDENRFMEDFSEKLLVFFKKQKPPAKGIDVETEELKTGDENHLLLREVWKIGEEFRLNDRKRKEDQEVFQKVLKTSRWIANLGVPGIGKTTNIFKLFGKNSLILYTSPRTYLNTELINKWCEKNTNMVAFYTQSEHPDTVFYMSKDPDFKLPEELNVPKLGKVRLQKLDKPLEESEEYSTVREVTYTLSSDKRLGEKGVLNRLLNTVSRLLEDESKPLKGREILVAFATQAVLKRKDGGSTLEHLRKFFLDRYRNPKFDENLILKILKKRFVSNGIKDIVFVMDEITGSETGRFLFRTFLDTNWFKELQKLAEEKLDLRLYFVLLDASLKGFEVFKTFAQDEDERPIIYTDIGEKVKTSKGIDVSEVEVKKVKFTSVDAVGFPAAELEFYYNFLPVEDKEEKLIPYLVGVIKRNIQQAEEGRQIFLFLQNKKLLEKLKKEIVERKILKEDDILVIHSLSERGNKEEAERKRLILATSSASRGLTFPLIDTYIAVIPDFSVEGNLTELVQALFRGRDKNTDGKTLEDGKRKVIFIFPLKKGNGFASRKARALEIATLLKASLFTITCGGVSVDNPDGEKVLKIVPVGVQREKVFHPLKEFERRISGPKRVLRQLQKTARDKVRETAYLLEKELNEFLKRVRFNLPYRGVQTLINLLEETEKRRTLKEFLEIGIPDGVMFDFLTVKGHNLFLGFSLVRAQFEIDPARKKEMWRLLKKLEELEPKRTLGLRPLKDFLKRGKIEHTDLHPSGVDRVLIIPPLGWEYSNFDPTEVVNLDIPSMLRDLLYHFLGDAGKFHPEREQDFERPFGITDLDAYLFDEINKDFLKSGNLMLSSEVNLLELLI